MVVPDKGGLIRSLLLARFPSSRVIQFLSKADILIRRAKTNSCCSGTIPFHTAPLLTVAADKINASFRYGLSSYDEMCYNFIMVYEAASSPTSPLDDRSSSPAARGGGGNGRGMDLDRCVSTTPPWTDPVGNMISSNDDVPLPPPTPPCNDSNIIDLTQPFLQADSLSCTFM